MKRRSPCIAGVLTFANVARAEAPAPEPTTASGPGSSTAADTERVRAELETERPARAALEARTARSEDRARPDPGALPIAISGYVHVDWVVFRQTSQDEVTQSGEPLNEDRFVLRRARLRAERDQGLFHAAFELDANTVTGPQLRPIHAEASLKWPAHRAYPRTPWAVDPTGTSRRVDAGGPAEHRSSASPLSDAPSANLADPWFMVTAGLFRTPFGYEVPESERERPWLDRSSTSNALFPQSFDLGLRIVGGFSFVRYAFAVMNGEPIGERTFPGRDPNESKDLVFRVGGATAVTSGFHVEGGLSGVSGRGFHKGQPAAKDVLQWQDTNANGVVDSLTEITVIPGAPATPSAPFTRFAVGADLRATIAIPVLGDLRLRGEVVRGSNLDRGSLISDPVVQARDLRQFGFYVGASQEITPWALIGVRYDRYDPDADAREREPFSVVPRDASLSTWSFSASGRTRVARLVAQYDHRQNALGRDTSGRPTTLADDSFTLRAEVRF